MTDETKRDLDPDAVAKEVAFHNMIKASAWDEIRELLPELTKEIRDLRDAIDGVRDRSATLASPVIRAVLVSVFVVAIALSVYFAIFTHDLENRIHKLENGTTTTTGTTTATPTTAANPAQTNVNVVQPPTTTVTRGGTTPTTTSGQSSTGTTSNTSPPPTAPTTTRRTLPCPTALPVC